MRESEEFNRVEPLCQPAFYPSFRISKQDKIYTIGSCFARNIEKVMVYRGFDVVTSKLPVDDPAFDKLGTELLNNYGVTSIQNEFEWGLDPDRPFDANNNTLEIAPGRFIDLHLVPSIKATTLEAVLARREAIISVTRKIVDCRIVIITLGLSEVWYDTYTSTYFNYAIPRTAIAKAPDRYELHVLSYEETIGCLHKIMALLKKYCRADQRVVLTVSPVPLSATHTTDDVIVANAYSKAALRTAAGTIAAEYPNVDYFPSYESVTHSDRQRAWKHDQTHVQGEIVELNVSRMIAAYTADDEVPQGEETKEAVGGFVDMRGEALDAKKSLGEAKKRVREGNFRGAIELTESLLDGDLRIAAQQVRAVAFTKLSQWAQAEIAYREFVAAEPENPSAHGDLARVLTAQDKNSEAIAMLERACALAPTAAHWAQHLASVLVSVGRLTEAAAIVNKWLAVDPTDQRFARLNQRIIQIMGRSEDLPETPVPVAVAKPEETPVDEAQSAAPIGEDESEELETVDAGRFGEGKRSARLLRNLSGGLPTWRSKR
jgi:Flp pilus assembly protein TadD